LSKHGCRLAAALAAKYATLYEVEELDPSMAATIAI